MLQSDLVGYLRDGREFVLAELTGMVSREPTCRGVRDLLQALVDYLIDRDW